MKTVAPGAAAEFLAAEVRDGDGDVPLDELAEDPEFSKTLWDAGRSGRKIRAHSSWSIPSATRSSPRFEGRFELEERFQPERRAPCRLCAGCVAMKLRV